MTQPKKFWAPNGVTLHAGSMPKQGDSLVGPGSPRGDHAYVPVLPVEGSKLKGIPPSVKKLKRGTV